MRLFQRKARSRGRLKRSVRSCVEVVRDSCGVYGKIADGIRARGTVRRTVVDMLLVLLISAALAYFCNIKEGGLDLYMTTFLPMMGVLAAIFLFTEALGCNRKIALSTAFLILTGVAIQIVLRLPVSGDTADAARDLVLYAAISALFAVAVLPLLCALTSGRLGTRGIVLFLDLMMIGMYLFLLVFGRTHNGTTAWIGFGGMEFQLTEAIKVIAMLTMALAFRDRELDGKKRLWLAVVTLGINGVFLLIVNELGTLCVLGVVFFAVGASFLPEIRRLLVIVAGLVAAATMVLLVCRFCYQMKYPDTETMEAMPVGEAVDLCARIYGKFELRMDLLLNPDSVDPNGGGYQIRKARESMVLSKWLGSAAEVAIPVAESDYVFCYLILKMGVAFGIAVLLILLSMFLTAVRECLRNPIGAEGAVGYAFMLGIVVQALLAAASATGYFLTVGVPFAFLADGGSATLTNYTMVIFVLYTTRLRYTPIIHGRTKKLERKEQTNE